MGIDPAVGSILVAETEFVGVVRSPPLHVVGDALKRTLDIAGVKAVVPLLVAMGDLVVGEPQLLFPLDAVEDLVGPEVPVPEPDPSRLRCDLQSQAPVALEGFELLQHPAAFLLHPGAIGDILVERDDTLSSLELRQRGRDLDRKQRPIAAAVLHRETGAPLRQEGLQSPGDPACRLRSVQVGDPHRHELLAGESVHGCGGRIRVQNPPRLRPVCLDEEHGIRRSVKQVAEPLFTLLGVPAWAPCGFRAQGQILPLQGLDPEPQCLGLRCPSQRLPAGFAVVAPALGGSGGGPGG